MSCVTRTPLIVSHGGRNTLGRVHTLAWTEAEPVRVQGPRGDILTLDLALQYEIVHIPHDRERGTSSACGRRGARTSSPGMADGLTRRRPVRTSTNG